ncbi:MAG: flagellar motor switch protein FliN [candidate division Zixibacteria bacterium]|nr:flagellar motor switch protein FliN [candidate division Zixibacteria bacterium]
MDEEKQIPLDDDSETKPADMSSEPQDAAADEESSKSDDLSMPDMDLPNKESDEQSAQTETDGQAAEADTGDQAEQEIKADSSSEPEKANPDDWGEDDAEAAMLKMMEKEAAEAEKPSELSADDSQPIVQKAAFENLKPENQAETQNLDLLLDVTLPISIELGRTSMAIENILNLSPGSVIELDKLAGEPVDLLVNNKLLAKGEVVVIDENFGVRITSMISPKDRIRNLQ